MVPLLWFILPKAEKWDIGRNGENNVQEKEKEEEEGLPWLGGKGIQNVFFVEVRWLSALLRFWKLRFSWEIFVLSLVSFFLSCWSVRD